jgi:hypothetical protein
MSKTKETKVPGVKGRPAGSSNKPKFKFVKISDLLSVLNEDTSVPVSITFVEALLGATTSDESFTAKVKAKKDENKIPVTTHTIV